MIVVTGATGNVGRPLTEALTAAGEEVVTVSRHAPSASLLGVRHAPADLAHAESLRPALEGADALFLLPAGELLGPGEPATALLDMAASAGVKRVVLLSSQINSTRPEVPSHFRLREFEEAVRGSGVDFTVLRPSGFASNAFAWAESVRTERKVYAPFGDVALPVVDPADIAAVAALALREDGHGGRTYELTGPEAISPRRQTEAIAEVLGEEVTFVELTREAAHAQMARFMPANVIEGTLDILGAPLPAEQKPSPDVRAVLARPATPFTTWAAHARRAFA